MALGEKVADPSPRRPKRITFLRPVHLRALGQRAPLKRMFAGNLSLGGMYVRSPSAFSPGTRVEVFLEARGQVLPFAEATVVFAMPREEASAHRRLPGFGLRFTRLPPRSRALVEELLRIVPQGRAGSVASNTRARAVGGNPSSAGPAEQERSHVGGKAPSPAGTRRRHSRVGVGLALGALLGGATAAAVAAFPHFVAWLALWP